MQASHDMQAALSGGDADEFMRDLIVRRRHNLPTRLIAAVAIALMNTGAVGAVLAWAWLLVYASLQLVEGPIYQLLLNGRGLSIRLREIGVLSLLGLSTLVFGSLAIPLWCSANWMGPAVAILMLVGAMGNAAVVGRGMKAVFLVSFTPYFLLLILGPFLAAAASHTSLQAALCVGPIVISANMLSSYWRSEGLRDAEAKARAELDQKRAEAVAATQAKSSFVATVSHDLRTPLSAILACAGAIQRDAKDDKEASRAAMISDAAKMMRRLLDDLLDLAKIEAGHMTFEVVAFDPCHLVDDIARFWSDEAAAKGLTLTVRGADTLPALVGGDPIRIRQILNNLLSNAVKFTDSGGVMIETFATAKDGGYSFSAAVVDSGIGLSELQLCRLFTRFDQTEASVARTHGGTGLGLAISRELSRLMGGELSVSSKQGEGARFTMTCNLTEAAANLDISGGASDCADVADLRVLVVDDHELNRRALTLLLEPLGVVPVLAACGEEALALLAAQSFDLVLMDLNMGGLNGCETTLRLRAVEGANRDIPVIAVTGAVEPKVLQDCLDAGMNAWVEKPLEAQTLYEAIERVLSVADNDDQAVAA